MKPRSVNEVLCWLVVLLAFSLPLYRAWISMAAALIPLLWFFQDDLGQRLHRLVRHRLTIAVMVFLAVNLVSLLWSDDPVTGLDYLAKYRYLLLIPAVASSIDRTVARRAALAFLAGTVLAAAMMPVVIIGDIHFRHSHPDNPSVTMSHLDFSMVLAVAAVLATVHLVHGASGRRSRLEWSALLLVLVGGLVINIGRSGQIAFIATMVVLTPVSLARRPWWVRGAALAGVVGVIALIYVTVPRFQARLDQGASEVYRAVVHGEVDGNQGKRVAGIVVGLDILRAHPVLGTGVGANMPEFRSRLATDHSEFEEAIGWFDHMHNQYLQVATELGMVGLAALLGIFVALFSGRYRSFESRSAAVAVGCVYLFGFFGDPFLHKQIPLVLFALAAGVVSSDDQAIAGHQGRRES